MKIRVLLLMLFCLVAGTAKSATITWANTNGGNWNVATNWSPVQVPVSGDDVIITNSGTYAITNASSVTLDNLTLGGMNGIQTLTISSLTLTNIGLVNSNGIFIWNGGDLEGAMTVAPGGTLIQSNTMHVTYNNYALGYTNTAYLTNCGTVIWAGVIDAAANGTTHGGGGYIYNAGLWDVVADMSMGEYSGAGTNYFINTGTLEKTAANGTSTISWSFSSSGYIDTYSGSFNLNWGGPSVLNGNLALTGTISTPLTVASNAVLTLVSTADLESALTVAQGGTLIQSNTMHFACNNYALSYTNTAYLTNYGAVIWSGSIDAAANGTTHGGGGIIYNAGLWDAVGDLSLGIYSGAGTNNFINTGTLEKTGGAGTATISWNLSNNGGTINTPSGTFDMGNWIGSGVVHGTAAFLNGTVSGTLASDCVMNASAATITGPMVISSNAVVSLNGGDLEGSLTVAQGGTLTQSNTLHFTYNNFALAYTNTAYLTNYGTVIWAGTIDAAANGTTHGGGGVIYNAGLWDAVADMSMGEYSGAGTNYFINTGTLEKTAANGFSTISWNFSTSGFIDTYSGSFNLNWGGPSVLQGTLALSGTISTPLTVASNAVLTLFSTADLESALTVAQGGTLIQSNTLHFAYNNYALSYTNTAYLTNYGTVIWAGSIDAAANGTTHGGGVIYNAGLWEAVADLSLGVYSGAGTNYFINAGTLEKTAATGTSTIGWTFDSQSGTLETLSGYFTFTGIWDSSSVTYGQATVSQNISGIIASNGVITWLGGDLESFLTVAQGGTLIQSNTLHFTFNNYALSYTNTAYLTNYGTVIWGGAIDAAANGTTHGGGGVIYNAGLWKAVGDLAIGVYSGAGTNYFLNPGTLEKTGGSGTSTIGWTVKNSGTLGSQTNTLFLTGNYDLSAGTLNSGINNLTNYGTISLAGAAPLTGTVSANLNNGYIPIGGNSFTNLFYGSFTGIFTNSVLPFADAWSTNYQATHFVLNVLNARPILASLPTNTFVVNELTNLTVTNNATDADIPGQTLTNSLAAGTNGMAVNPVTGVFTWTPQQTNSPSTNVVSVAVTDNGTPPLSATNTFTVIVKEVNVAPSLPTISTQIVNELTLLTVTNSATNFNIHSTIVGYALVSPPSNMVINASGIITWTPVQPQSPGTNLITTIVTNSNPYHLVNPQLTSTNTFTVIVKEVNVAPSLPTVLTNTINELTLLTVTNTATNFNIHATITGYQLVSPPSNMVVSASGIITWTPAQPQSPSTNLITTVVTNSNPYDLVNPQLTSTNTFTVIVKEVNVAPSLPTVLTNTINELTLLTVTNTATNFNIHATITGYQLVSPPSNMVVSASGIITWTPAQPQSPSTNLITTIVTNSNPYDLVNPQLTSTNTFTVIVKEVNVAPSLPTVLTNTINELTLLTVTNTATNFNIHATTTGYQLVSPPSNMVVSASGIITWTPAQPQSPSTNLITTIVTNSNPYDLVNPQLTSTNTFTVIVREVNVAPVLLTISTQTITLLKPFSITNGATEPNIHSVTGNYLLLVSPAGAAIDNSGVITWTPAQNQSLTTNTITTVVTNSNPYDLIDPHLSSTNSFSVIALPNTIVTNIAALNLGGTNLTLSWPADHTGWRLEVQTNTLARGISTNWATLTGSSATNREIITIVSTNKSVFFRMVYP